LSDSIYGYSGEGSPNAGLPESYFSSDNIGTERVVLQRSMKAVTDQNGLQLCLHAKELCIFHPVTGAPLIFKCDPPF